MKSTSFFAVLALLFCFSATSPADDDLFDDDDASTAAGDVIEARGELARGLGKGSYLKSLSAKQLQAAIDKMLDNRRESVETYYKLRELRDEAVDNETNITQERAQRIAAMKAPDRLTKSQIDRNSGKLYWPSPLDDDALAAYRKPIEETLKKRSSPGEEYNKWDHLKVRRMVSLISAAVESVEDRMDPAEVVALNQYLDRIDYESRFNAADERVDF
ncbi:hypothetical protein FYK55_04250 [Roseiconus nitratireducens]|uniref:RxLR effector protein n=1 Tax=Roseiconus nitratireducens TaxID=2605748 RepID=A0A5M6DEX9_9BACT|nr:hypothetical protein [Roseiconus nitratireducens]KAA5546114.1 hypothetical protein FYK55_04250 [Roseiconus nitratireducens]